MSLGGFTAAAAKVVLGVESEGYTTQLHAAEAEFSQAVGVMGARTAELSERQLRGSVASERYVNAIQRYGPASTEARASLANLITEHRKLAEVQEQTALESTKLQRSLTSTAGSGKIFSGALSLTTNALLGGAGFVYAVHSAISAASQFQGEMTLLQTQALKTHAEVERMTVAVKKMAPALATSPEDLAKGLYHVESAGYAGAKALNVLTVAAKGARLGHSDLEQTVNALIASQKSGIKGAQNLGQAMGVLDAIVGSSNTRMEDLAKGLSSGVLSAAAGAGVSLAQLGGAFSVLTIQGTPAELAMTRLRYAIALISAQTPKAEKELRGIGLTSNQLGETLQKQGLVPALELLRLKMQQSGLDAQGQQKVLERAFGGGRSYTTLLTLYRNLDQVNSLTKEIDSQGIHFGARWEAQTKTAEYAFARLSAVASVLKIQLGDALLPPSVHAANDIAGWLENSKNQLRVQHDVVQAFHDAKEAAGVFATGLHQLGDVLHITDDLLGGSGKTLKVFLEALLLLKARNFAKSINDNLLQPLRGVPKAAQDAQASIEAMAAKTVDTTARANFVLPWNKQAADNQKILDTQAAGARKASTEIQAALTETADVNKQTTDVAVSTSKQVVAAAQEEADGVVAANNEQIASIGEVQDAWANMAATMTGLVGASATAGGSPFAPSIIPIPAAAAVDDEGAAHVATQERLTSGLGKFSSNDPVDQAMIMAATRVVRANALAGKPPLNAQDLREALSADGPTLAALAKVTSFKGSDYGGEARVSTPVEYDPLGALSYVPPNKRGGTRAVPSAITSYVAKNGPRPTYAEGSKAYYADIAAQMGITTSQAKSLVRQYEGAAGQPYAGSNQSIGQRQVPEAQLGEWAEIPTGLTEAQMTALMGELSQRGLIAQPPDPYASMAARDRAATAARIQDIKPAPILSTSQNRTPQGTTYRELYNEAERLKIPGRSGMNKAQLQAEIAKQQVVRGLLSGQRVDTVPTRAAAEQSDDAFHRMRRIREAQPAAGFQSMQEAQMAGVGSFVASNGLPGEKSGGALYYSQLAKQLGVTQEQARVLAQQFVELADAEEAAAKAALTYRMDSEATLGGKLGVLQAAQEESASANAKLAWKQNLAAATPAGMAPGETWRLGIHPSQISQLEDEAAAKQAQLAQLSTQYGQAQADAQARQAAGSKLLADATRASNVEVAHENALLENQQFDSAATAQKRLADGSNTLAGLTAKTSAATEKLTGVTRDMRLGLSSAADRVAMTWQDVTKEGEAAGLTETQITSLMTAEQLRAKALADLTVDEKFFDDRLALEAGTYNEVTDSVNRLTEAQTRQNTLAKERAALGLTAGLSSGGQGIFLGAGGAAGSPGALAKLRGGVAGLGSTVGSNISNNAFGYGLALSLFGSQIPQRVGITGQTGKGISNVLTGAGSGLIFAPMLGVNPLAGVAVGASFGLKSAIGGARGSTRSHVGSLVGDAGEGAAAGALLGTLGGPLAPLSVPVGAAAGALVGLTAGLLSMSHHANATVTQLDNLAAAANHAAGGAAAARTAIQAGKVQLANDLVSRDQSKAALATAKSEEEAARKTKGHQAALDNLRAAQANYDQSLRQIQIDIHGNQQAQLHLTQAEQQAQKVHQQMVGTLQKVADSAKDFRIEVGRGGQMAATGAEKVQHYADQMNGLANSMKTSHPKLAAAAAELAQIAIDANKIPSQKTVDVVVKFGYDPASLKAFEDTWSNLPWNKDAPGFGSINPLMPTPTGQAIFKNGKWVSSTTGKPVNQAAAYAAFLAAGHGPVKPKSGDTVNVPAAPPKSTKQTGTGSVSGYVAPTESSKLSHLDTEISAAQYAGNTKLVQSLIEQEQAWLLGDLKSARTDAQKKAVTDALNQNKSTLSSMDTKALSNGGVGLIPQKIQDAVQTAIQGGDKAAQVKAYTAQQTFLTHYLASHKTGLAHHKAELLLTQTNKHLATLVKAVSGGVPPALYKRQQAALQNLATHPGGAVDVTSLKSQRAVVEKFLSEKGHDKKDRSSAEATLKKLNAEIKSGKGVDYYTPVIKTDQAIAAYFKRQSNNPKNDLATRMKDLGLVTKYDNAAAALVKKRDGGTSATTKYGAAFVPLEIAYQKALQTTSTKSDDVKALTAEQKYLQRFITDHPGKGSLQLAANKLLASIDTKLSGLHKTLNLQLQQMEAQFLQEQQNIQDQYASNVYTPGSGKVEVHVHQNFPHPPTADGHREAIYARQAALAHFDG